MPLNLTALRDLKGKILDATEEAARDIVLTKSNEYIPIDEAIAEHSGRIVRDGNRIIITYGRDDDGTADHAPSNEYIEVIHEDMEMNHPRGGTAKFLQRAADETAGTLAAAIGRKVKV
jgi:hypothetical protein